MIRILDDFFSDSVFDSFFGQQHGAKYLNQPQCCVQKGGVLRGAPADIWEENGKIMAKIDLPGVEKKDIDIKVHNGILEVKAQKKFEEKKEGKDFFRHERSFAGFFRAFSLPHKIEAEKIVAKYDNGVLEISTPKIEKEIKKIEVK